MNKFKLNFQDNCKFQFDVPLIDSIKINSQTQKSDNNRDWKQQKIYIKEPKYPLNQNPIIINQQLSKYQSLNSNQINKPSDQQIAYKIKEKKDVLAFSFNPITTNIISSKYQQSKQKQRPQQKSFENKLTYNQNIFFSIKTHDLSNIGQNRQLNRNNSSFKAKQTQIKNKDLMPKNMKLLSRNSSLQKSQFVAFQNTFDKFKHSFLYQSSNSIPALKNPFKNDNNSKTQYQGKGKCKDIKTDIKGSVQLSVKSAESQNIKVSIRFRPLQSGTLISNNSTNKSFIQILNKQVLIAQQKIFAFDKLYSNQDQSQIFQEISKPIIQKVFEGYNGTVFAYGQTGSGKTHTIFGDISEEKQLGLIPRSIKYIFQRKHFDFRRITCSLIQIYKEQIYDMFSLQQSQSSKKSDLKIKQNKQKGVYIENLTQISANSQNQLIFLISQALKSRKTSATKMNQKSSRSHTILTINLEFDQCVSKLNLIDLAGSEKVRKSGVFGESLEQTKKINYSLSCLGNVINALTSRSNSEHIPYRDSKLTRILKDSLNGKSLTSIIITCHQGRDFFNQTLSSLKFAERAKRVKILPQNKIKMSQNHLQFQQSTSRMGDSVQAYENKIQQLSLELIETKKQLEMYRNNQMRPKQFVENLKDKKSNNISLIHKDAIIITNRTNQPDVGDLTGRLPIPSERACVTEIITKYTVKQIVPLFLGSKRPSINQEGSLVQSNLQLIQQTKVISPQKQSSLQDSVCYQITQSKRGKADKVCQHTSLQHEYADKQSDISFSFSIYHNENLISHRNQVTEKSTRRSIR